MSDNPYQAPAGQFVIAPPAHLTEEEVIRTKHLKHEALLKTVGFLHFLSGMIVALFLLGLILISGDLVLLMLGLLILLGIAHFSCGAMLLMTRPWVKIPATVLAGICLIAIPFGTLLGGYTLYLLFSAKGRMVLSAAYAEIIAQTPQLCPRTPLWVWITLGAILLLIVIALLGSL